MENSTEKIIRLLLTYPDRKWMQKDLAEETHCSRAFVSKLMHRFQSENIIARPYKNQVVLVGFSKLLNKWSGMRKLPEPVYIETTFSEEEIEGLLRKQKDYVLTLFRAAWYRTKFMKTNSFEVYVSPGNLERFMSGFGDRTTNPAKFIIYECGEQVFEGMEVVEGLNLVSVVQNYVDLMSFGGTGNRVAFNLGEKYGLIG
ncbi:MAG: hypothetical protein U9Q22_02595 [Candidatus Altiarchaeota archaeon]|nr:hypothetical protein [Candidatus Altiarchaeota archaeon]